ncbi:hypothetical protein FRC17_004365 [Serendipita sp. 399]|nr:hypothetical protein FRC17_004365 [Serendipita sp. 399]
MDTQTQPPRPSPSFSTSVIPQQRARPLVNGAVGAAAAGRIPPSLQAKMAALANRSQQANSATKKQNAVNETVEALMRATLADRPPLNPSGAPVVSTPGLGSNPLMRMGSPAAAGGMHNRRVKPVMKLSDMTGFGGAAETFGLRVGRPASPGPPPARRAPPQGELGTPFASFSKIVDPSGALNFNGKAILHAKGVDFSNGASFSISMNQFTLEDELGKGNYGTVRKVIHKPTKVAMAMKEIRLELEDQKLNAIIMELDILHRAVAPEIVEFYGAFFVEGCVYYCMEYMDAGSLDKLQGSGVDEPVLARISGAMVRGLKFLKDQLQIMHRDVKPTNVLVSRQGVIKLCDFGVSGQLEKSLAKTNIGCQSYMAPERIQGESINNLGTYSVSSDVWSLGLSIIEVAMGKYPYPPETYANVFAQLTAIVQGDPPTLPDGFSDEACDFVGRCLMKEPTRRATYAELLEHPFLLKDAERGPDSVDMPGWVEKAIEWREKEKIKAAVVAELEL